MNSWGPGVQNQGVLPIGVIHVYLLEMIPVLRGGGGRGVFELNSWGPGVQNQGVLPIGVIHVYLLDMIPVLRGYLRQRVGCHGFKGCCH